jgi:F-type H+-transporting ATPase subunit b
MFVTSAFAQSSTPSETPAGTAPAAEAPTAAAHGGETGATHTETGVPHEAAHEGGFPPFESTYFGSQLLWLAIAFGLFYLFMSRSIAPRIGGIIEDRNGRIAADLAEAGRMKSEADQAVATYELELANARSTAAAIAAKSREASKAKADEERKLVEAGLQEKIAAAEKSIAAIKTAALAEVGSIAEETAGAIVGELVGKGISQAEIATAVKAVSGK